MYLTLSFTAVVGRRGIYNLLFQVLGFVWFLLLLQGPSSNPRSRQTALCHCCVFALPIFPDWARMIPAEGVHENPVPYSGWRALKEQMQKPRRRADLD